MTDKILSDVAVAQEALARIASAVSAGQTPAPAPDPAPPVTTPGPITPPEVSPIPVVGGTPPLGQWVRSADVPVIPANFPVEEDFTVRPDKVANLSPVSLGAFRLSMRMTHHSKADPIIAPGMLSPHMHTWYGNPTTDENTTWRSLRENGSSSGEGGRINRSLYGFSSIIVEDMQGKLWLITPTISINYYKQPSKISGHWSKYPQLVRAPIPRGLRMVTGRKFYPDPKQWVWPHVPPINANLFWQGGNTPITSKLDELAPHWTEGRQLKVMFSFPTLNDGVHSDSPDHVSHMQFHRGNNAPPSSHLHDIPHLSFNVMADYPGFPVKRVYTSSDIENDVIREPGSTFHAYFADGWDEDFRLKMSEHLTEGFDTSNGLFGDGSALKWQHDKGLQQPPLPYEA